MELGRWMHTDLAVEARESFEGDGGEIPGVSLEEVVIAEAELKVTTVEILNEAGEKAMGKPVGTYITLESDFYNYEESCLEQLAAYIRRLLPETDRPFLTVGLGNQDMTADSLGPVAVNHLRINAHLSEIGGMSGITPGVMAQTGMETAHIIKGIVEATRPGAVIVVDALAARSTARLGRTIQLTDTGIHPGSGVGNHRMGINEESLGVPVIAIGVPTVVGTATIACDTLDALAGCLEQEPQTKAMAETIRAMSGPERHQVMQELMGKGLGGLFVTPKDIDETVVRLGGFVAEGINRAVEAQVTWQEKKVME